MSKQELRLFFTAFFITLLLFGFAAAFLLVDSNSSRRERGSSDELFSFVETAPGDYRVTLMGRDLAFSFAPLGELRATRAQVGELLTPRFLQTVGNLYDYSSYWGGELYELYKNYLYEQEVGPSG